MLIDGGTSHNFIDVALVNKRHLPIVEFEGFLVEVVVGRTMPCDRYIPRMSLTLGRHTRKEGEDETMCNAVGSRRL
jgi:hypothetical protein